MEGERVAQHAIGSHGAGTVMGHDGTMFIPPVLTWANESMSHTLLGGFKHGFYFPFHMGMECHHPN